MMDKSPAQAFQVSVSPWPIRGSPYRKCGAGGTAVSHASSVLRSTLTSSAPPGTAIANGSTMVKAVSATINAAAAARGRRMRPVSHAKAGQVANTRMAAQSKAEKNGYSTKPQPSAMPPMSMPIKIRSAITVVSSPARVTWAGYGLRMGGRGDKRAAAWVVSARLKTGAAPHGRRRLVVVWPRSAIPAAIAWGETSRRLLQMLTFCQEQENQ